MLISPDLINERQVRIMKRVFLYLVIILLLFSQSACTDNSTKTVNAAAPVYTVKDITESLGLKAVGSIKMNLKNQLVINDDSDGSNSYIIVDADGKTVNNIKCGFKGDGRVFAMDAGDNLYILVQNAVSDDKTYKVTEDSMQLLVYDSKGEKQKSVELGKVTMQEDENIYVQDMSIDSEGNIYLIRNNETPELMDGNGKVLKSPLSGMYGFLDIDEKGNIIAGSTGADKVKSFIACMDSKNGKAIWKKELDAGIYIRSICYNRSDKCIYTVTDKSVDKYDSNGNLTGMVLEFMKYNLIGDKMYIGGLGVDSSGSLYVLINEENAAKVKKFEIGDGKASTDNSASTQTKPVEKKVITLSAHFSDRWLESAVSAFQSEHPDIEISVKDYKGAYYGGGDTLEEARGRQEEFVNTLNTELMTGKGPDIIYFANLPYRKYIDKKMFVNLSNLMEKDDKLNKAELNANILDALKYKGGLYAIPINYGFELMVASKSILDKESIKIDDMNWTWDDFMQMAQKVTKDTNGDGTIDQYAIAGTSNAGIFSYLFNSSKYVDLDKKTVGFDNKDFINLLESCKAFNDKKLFYKAKDWEQIRDMTSRGGVVFSTAGFSSYSMANYYSTSVYSGEIYKLHMPSDNTAGSRKFEFDANNMLAINSNSKYQVESWEFLKVLLSKKMQSSPALQNGFPINDQALGEIAKFSVEYLHMPQKKIDEINKFLPNVGEYHYDDGKLRDIISEDIKEFFSGNKSAEETAKSIQSKAATALNE
jgi:multiple sugar transport system substrate-binding protein